MVEKKESNRILFVLDPGLKKQVRDYCDAKSINLSDLLRKYVKKLVDEWELERKNKAYLEKIDNI